MVNHEAGVPAEAPWAKTGAVTIARDDQEIDRRSGGGHFTLGEAGAQLGLAGSSERRSGLGEKVLCRGTAELVDRG